MIRGPYVRSHRAVGDSLPALLWHGVREAWAQWRQARAAERGMAWAHAWRPGRLPDGRTSCETELALWAAALNPRTRSTGPVRHTRREAGRAYSPLTRWAPLTP
jgi:hypothetical protein